MILSFTIFSILEAEIVLSKCFLQNYRPAHQPDAKLASPEAPLLPLCLSADTPTPLATTTIGREGVL